MLNLSLSNPRGSVRRFSSGARWLTPDRREWLRFKPALTVDREVLLVGHTHTPFIRHVGNRVVVNPGSLGQPKTGKPDACYAVWEKHAFQLKSFPYSVDETVGRIQALSFPKDVENDLITVLKTGSV